MQIQHLKQIIFGWELLLKEKLILPLTVFLCPHLKPQVKQVRSPGNIQISEFSR